MKKSNEDTELRTEYKRDDLGKGVRGKYYQAYQKSHNLLDSEIAKILPNDKAVNDTLISLLTRLERENFEVKVALHQADRLAYLGRMATMMAHNIKNPVNNIATAATSMKMGLKSNKITPEKQLESLDRILNNSERLNQTIEHFRNFSQADTTECANIDLNETLEDAYQLLFAGQYQLHHIELTRDYDKSSPITHSNSFTLQEVLTTLLNNAKEALRDQAVKKVTISTWKKADKVGFSIEDNGGGIVDEENKLFTPFFSSKKHGMGLGLYCLVPTRPRGN